MFCEPLHKGELGRGRGRPEDRYYHYKAT
jgi:hypothetical protein